MKRRHLFQFMSVLTIWFYTAATVMAGQVITNGERKWAQAALKQEADLGLLGATESVAVLNYANMTGDERFDSLQKGLALMLITDLSKVENLYVVERIKIQALLDEMELGTSGLADPSTAPKVGNLIRAGNVVSGDITQGGFEALTLGTSLLDVPKAQTRQLPEAGGDLDDLLKLEKEILFNIIDRLEIHITEEERKSLMIPLSTSATALLALFLGIEYSDTGRYEKAAEMYNEALSQDPGMELAHESLTELQNMGLVSDRTITVSEEGAGAAAEGGSSMGGTVLAIGLGLAAIGGAVALAGGSSGSDDGDSNQETTPNTNPTAPLASTGHGDTIDCYGDSVTFSFSQPMNMNYGSISVSNIVSSKLGQQWLEDEQYQITFGYTSDCYYYDGSATSLTLENFRSADGVALGGTTVFNFTYTEGQ